MAVSQKSPTSPTSLSPAAFERFVVLLNPVSTHHKQAERFVHELEKLAPPGSVTTVHTVPGGRTANHHVLRKHAHLLGPQTLLCLGGGDGTANMAVETLLTDPRLPAAARCTPILPLWGGNANDLAHMLNGAGYRTHMEQVLAKGGVVPIHPLDCVVTLPGGHSEHHIAICYASFGATAFAAQKFNAAPHRASHWHRLPGGRAVKELLTGFSALMEAPTYAVQEENAVKPVYDRIFANGSRFAKVGRLPLKLTDDLFLLDTWENKRVVPVLSRIVRLLHMRVSEGLLRNRSSFTVSKDTLAQFDGEPLEIPAGTHIMMQLSAQPFYALTTKLLPRQ